MVIAILGGGAAGMMAAVQARKAAPDAPLRIIILEQNEKLGKKLFITGKGRCNLTNEAEGEDFFSHVISNPRFLYSSFRAFDNQAVKAFFAEEGLVLKTERGGRVFPASDKSSDVIKVFERYFAARRSVYEIRLNTKAEELLVKEGRVEGLRVKNLKNGRWENIQADRVILAGGGLSYPSTGASGEGYELARASGHALNPCRPALVPLNASFSEAAEAYKPEDLMGLSLKNVSLSAKAGKKQLFKEQGEMLFTHFGVSGPLVLSCSSRIGRALEEGQVLRLSIDLKPALLEEQLDARLQKDVSQAGAKALSSLAGAYLPKALIPVVLAQAGLSGSLKAAALSKAQRSAFIRALKDLPLENISLRDYPEAIITQGGVSVKDIDPKTMESKKIKGLYLAGEMLDLDASTGGFNLQIAWSTGAAAGRAAAQSLYENHSQEEKPMRLNHHIAIDGPGSSGKSTIAKLVAKETGLIYVDTGAMFRAMAIHFLRQGLEASDEAGITAACRDAEVTIAYEDGAQQVYLNGENVTPYLREEKTGQMASASSVYGPVREKMKELQQKLAAEKDVVMDGRDIGTVILPDAFLKIYLTASVEVRARRRYEELLAKGQEADLETISRELAERDWRDMHRKIAPLKQAEDAVLIDSDHLSIEEVKARILALYRGKE